MPSFGKRSRTNLDDAHPALIAVFKKVVQDFDCTVIEGYRGQYEQDAAFHAGKSKLRYPESKHNRIPSLAVDVCPYPIDWSDHRRFYLFAGYVMAVANSMGVKLRWGGDWDGDWTWKDQSFHDLPHFELVDAGPFAKEKTSG